MRDKAAVEMGEGFACGLAYAGSGSGGRNRRLFAVDWHP